MDETMKKQYIKPTIEVITQKYDNGICQMVIGSAGYNGGSEAKPGDEWDGETWGDIWAEPTISDDDLSFG